MGFSLLRAWRRPKQSTSRYAGGNKSYFVYSKKFFGGRRALYLGGRPNCVNGWQEGWAEHGKAKRKKP